MGSENIEKNQKLARDGYGRKPVQLLKGKKKLVVQSRNVLIANKE